MGTRVTGLVGAAGEYYVAAELSRRGWLATVTIKNAPGTDVLAQNRATGRVVAIQTKTANYDVNEFWRPQVVLGEWFVFVKLRGEDERPRFFIVPADVVSATNPQRAIRVNQLTEWEGRWDLLDPGGAL